MTTPETSRAVYYALDNDPRCRAQFQYSVASVRRSSPGLRIYAAWAGALGAEDRAFLADHQVTVLPTRLEAGLSPLFLKWRALAHDFRETDLLYLDTDTIAHGDLGRLFEAQGPEDFQARREIATEPEAEVYPYLVNTLFVGNSQIDHPLFASVCRSIGAQVRPVWNTGVMLFRNGLAGRLADRWEDFLRLVRLLWSKRLPYPCTNPHIADEVVGSLVLGLVEPLSWAFLPREACPSFLEYMGRAPCDDALVVHTWSQCYPSYLCHVRDLAALRAYLALPGRRGPRRPPGALRLTLGTSRWRPSPQSLEKWVRFGGAAFKAGAAARRAGPSPHPVGVAGEPEPGP
jgi:hypothetical protein